MKPEMRTSDLVASWPIPARYFFALLWGYLDDKGRGLDVPKLIAADCFPHDDDITADMADEWLNIMTEGLQKDEQGPICRYEVKGRKYLHCVNWSEHQHPNRPTPSRLPPCPIHECDKGHRTEPPPEPLTEPLSELSREAGLQNGRRDEEPQVGTRTELLTEPVTEPLNGHSTSGIRSRGAGEVGASTYVGGGSSGSVPRGPRDDPPPPKPATTTGRRRPRCDRHAGIPDDEYGPNCGACADARKAAETVRAAIDADAERQRLAELATVRACRHCDAEGWRLDEHRIPITPYQRCDHRRLQAVPDPDPRREPAA
jgi:hypothetical protein